MGNLGWYEWITTTSKKVGGPLQLIGSMLGVGLGAGIAIGSSLSSTVAKWVEKRKTADEDAEAPESDKNRIEASKEYVVTAYGVDEQGHVFNVGDQFRVLNKNVDTVLIEKLDAPDNHYLVSEKFLRSISTYR